MRATAGLSLLGLLIACVMGLASVRGDAAAVATPLETPATADSGMYSLLTGADGRAYLSWIDTAADKTATLRFARFEGQMWSAARTVATGKDWFVNWADHPSVTASANGTLYAHYLVTNPGHSTYGYGIRIARSDDAGATWREIFTAGTDSGNDYAGFVSLLPEGRELTAVYLTPTPGGSASPAAAGHEEEHMKSVAVARFAANGSVTSNAIVDRDACTCCSTSVTRTSAGLVAAYRDHVGGIRDISIIRQVNGAWTEPARVSNDNWAINACPTNGPSLASRDRRVAAAWFTAAGDVPRVKLAFSSDAGATFKAPVQIDGGKPVGWPSTVMLDDGSVVVSWLEGVGNGNGEVRVRRATSDGRVGPPVTIASAKAGRLTGIPHLVRNGQNLLVAWRDGKVRTALVATPDMPATTSAAQR